MSLAEDLMSTFMRRITSRRREYRATVRGVERRVIVDDKGSFDDQVG